MSGMKGRSGGARPGAGRKPKAPTILQLSAMYDDPEKFLRAVMNDSETDVKVRLDAAKALMPYMHAKKGEQGKKEDAAGRAKMASAGKFASSAPPKLVVNNK